MRRAKVLASAVILIAGFLTAHQAFAKCEKAIKAADDIYNYARRAERTAELDVIKHSAVRVRNAASLGAIEASRCGCDDATPPLNDAERHGRQLFAVDRVALARELAGRAIEEAELARNRLRACMAAG